MKRTTLIFLSAILYVGLAILLYFAAQWYVDKKEDREYHKTYERLEDFFSKQKMFVNISYHGNKVAYEQIPIPKYEKSKFTINEYEDKENWKERWGDVYKVYKLKPRYTSERSWESDNEWTGWRFTILERDPEGFSEYYVFPYQVAYKKQSESWLYNYMPSVQEAVNESFEFHTQNEKSDYKKYIVPSDDYVSDFDVRRNEDGWNDYFIFFSYDERCRIWGKSKVDSLMHEHGRSAKRLIQFRSIDEEETRYYGGMYNGLYKVNNKIQPLGHWVICYNFFWDPKSADRKNFLVWGESILAALFLAIISSLSAIEIRKRKEKEESLKNKLLRLCNPKQFTEPYDEFKLSNANDIYERLVATSPDDTIALKQIRKDASQLLGISFINPDVIKELQKVSNPQRYMNPYDPEKVRVANSLFNRLQSKDIDIEEVEDIQQEINEKLLGIS